MTTLSQLYQNINAEVAAKQTLIEVLNKVNIQIQDKIIMRMVPHYSINRINDMSHNVLKTFDAKHQTTCKDNYSQIQEPKPIYYDKLMQRTGQIIMPLKTQLINIQPERNKQSVPLRFRVQQEDYSKYSPQKILQNTKQQFSKSSFLLSFISTNTPSSSQNKLRKRKEDQERMKQKDDTSSCINHSLKNNVTEKEIGALLHLRKDYTYDQNGGIIPITKLQKISMTKPDIHYEFGDKNKQKLQIIQAQHARAKSKLKKIQLKLEETESCFYDSKSPFYKNFQIQKRNIQNKYRETPQKTYNGQLPNYMRILTQQGGIKKRYARYNTQKNELSVSSPSILKQKNRQSVLRNSQNLKRISDKPQAQITLVSSVVVRADSDRILHLPSASRIRIVNQVLRQKVIGSESNPRVQTNFSNFKIETTPNFRTKHRRQFSIGQQFR